MVELPLAPCGRILKKANPEMKFSKEAKIAFAEALEKEGLEISKLAVKIAKQEGRKTVQGKDIKRWIPFNEYEITDEEFVFKLKGWIHYSGQSNIKNWTTHEDAVIMPVKFLDNKLLFRGQLYDVKNVSEAERLMESHVGEILDSLMEPHWAYNIYEFRDWEPVETIGDHTLLSMWFDDYDGGDTWAEGILFNTQK